MKSYPSWVCNDCGMKHGAWYSQGDYCGPSSHCATYHHGKCEICGDNDVPVTEPRDFGHLVDWDVLRKDLIREQYRRKKHRQSRQKGTS